MAEEFLQDTMLSTTALIGKIKTETRYEEAGMGASPLFLRSDNSGRFRAILVLFRLGKDARKRTILNMEQVISCDIYDGSKIEYEPAGEFFGQMGIDARNPVYPARKGIDKDTDKQYRSLINITMDQIRLSAVVNGEVVREKYLEYLNYALYSYSDEFAKVLLAASRIFEFARYSVINCSHCGLRYKVNASSYATGQLITSKCPNCQDVNQTEYRKEGKVYVPMESYLLAYRMPAPQEPIRQESAAVHIADVHLDPEASFAVETRAQMAQGISVASEEAEAAAISCIPEAGSTADAHTVTEDGISKAIYGLGNVKRIFRAINALYESDAASGIPKVYALCGEAGQGIKTSIYYMTNFPQEAIYITDTENITAEQLESYSCCAIRIKTACEMLWLYVKLNELSSEKAVFLIGNADMLAAFFQINPAIRSLVLYTIKYKPYTASELYAMLQDRFRRVHFTVYLSEEEISRLFNNQDALSIKGIANRIYFKRQLMDKDCDNGITAKDIEKELS